MEAGQIMGVTTTYVQNGIRQQKRFIATYCASDGTYWLVKRIDTGEYTWVDPLFDTIVAH